MAEQPTALRGNKVDMLSTKNLDMKQRRCVNAAPAQDSGDYITLSQQNILESNMTAQVQAVIDNTTGIGKTGIFKLLGTDGVTYNCTFTNGILTLIVE